MKFSLAVILLSASCLMAAPRLTFTKVFAGSTPEYVWLSVDRTGALQYKESPKEDEQPVKAQLPEADVASLFALAEKMGYFKSPLESGLKVANTGKKTFRYEGDSGPATEVSFNYSNDPNAQQLLERFEQVAATERAWADLDRTVHFDKLGVNDSLATIESLWLRKQLVAPQQFVPLLERISSHNTFMHLMRERASRLKDEFTGTVPQSAAVPSDSKAK